MSAKAQLTDLARKTLVLTEEFFRVRYAFLYLLRVAWTKDGWMDTLEEEDVWDEDAYYAHLDDLDFD